MRNQTPLILLIIVTASLASFLGGYLLTQGSRDGSAIIQQQRGALIDRFNGVVDAATPTPLPPGLLQASTDATMAAVNVSDADSVQYYHPDSGYVSRIDLETRRSELVSTAPIPHLIRVIWSPDGNRVITVTRSTATVNRYAYFDYLTQEHGVLGADITDIVFSPDSKQIGLVRSPGGDSAIQIADFNGKNLRTVLKTRLDNIRLSWPAERLLSFISSDTDLDTQSLYTLSDNGDLTQIVSGENLINARWSPDGTQLAYSEQSSGTPALRLFSLASKKSRLLPIKTSAMNCAWPLDQRSLVCTAQNGGETSISRIQLDTGRPTVLFDHLIITPQNVFLSHLEDFLVIINAGDQSIWAVKL